MQVNSKYKNYIPVNCTNFSIRKDMDKVGVGKIGTKSVFRVMCLGKGGDWAHSFINQIKE